MRDVSIVRTENMEIKPKSAADNHTYVRIIYLIRIPNVRTYMRWRYGLNENPLSLETLSCMQPAARALDLQCTANSRNTKASSTPSIINITFTMKSMFNDPGRSYC